MTERSYLSIGDVLSLLREEFPDVTISKIRFLESRGLLVPERTPSGYRKFYDRDVDRLRWILRQQRENFLPLKVIKGRLEGQEPSSEPTHLFEVGGEGDSAPLEPVFAGQPANGFGNRREEATAHAPAGAGGRTSHSADASVPTPRVTTGPGAITPRPASEHPSRTRTAVAGVTADEDRLAALNGAEASLVPAAAALATPAVTQAAPSDPKRASLAAEGVRPSVHTDRGELAPTGAGASAVPSVRSQAEAVPAGPLQPAQARRQAAGQAGSSSPTVAAGAGSPSGARVAGAESGAGSRGGSDAGDLAGASLTVGELAQASGLDVQQVEELESYGLIESRMVAGVLCYDEEALVVAGLAAGFARFGVEARHLRMFKHAAERQASLYSQIVMPLLRQRNPDARRRAHDDLTRLAELGASMQACFAKAMLRDLTRG